MNRDSILQTLIAPLFGLFLLGSQACGPAMTSDTSSGVDHSSASSTQTQGQRVDADGNPVPPDYPDEIDDIDPAGNTGCDFHDTRSPYSASYDTFEHSLVGPRGNSGLSLQNQVERHQVGGASVAIIENFRITQHHWYGCRDRKLGLRTTQSTEYQAASLSKMVAAMAFTKAHRLGVLDLEKKVSVIANEHPNSIMKEWVNDKFRGTAAAYPQDITIKRLLNHTAGLDTHGIGAWEPGEVPLMRDIIMGSTRWGDSFAGGVEPLFAPKTRFEYSGGGFIVAEHALELKAGRAFKDYVQTQVLNPAGISATMDKAQDWDWLARGCSRATCDYDYLQTNVKAAGGLITSVTDYAELVVALANRGVAANGNRVLQASDVELMLTPAAHERSSFSACSTPGSLKFVVRRDGPSTTEVCVAGQFREMILDDDDWYGLGVGLSTTVEPDGFPRKLSHGGAQEGSRTYFKIDRRTGNGYVAMVNGVAEWTDSDGFMYGSEPLLDEIQTAYEVAY